MAKPISSTDTAFNGFYNSVDDLIQLTGSSQKIKDRLSQLTEGRNEICFKVKVKNNYELLQYIILKDDEGLHHQGFTPQPNSKLPKAAIQELQSKIASYEVTPKPLQSQLQPFMTIGFTPINNEREPVQQDSDLLSLSSNPFVQDANYGSGALDLTSLQVRSELKFNTSYKK
ncbi:hypothetical protein [Parashewanella tropica]|uniref:hypothetical protein n=1 Tax=Parashewanella tropica TaxID=2547970 RepID=UPI001059F8E8|nr:hypothetical protein [Parashewanella tropica]